MKPALGVFPRIPNGIPSDARISIVAETQIVPETEVREKFRVGYWNFLGIWNLEFGTWNFLIAFERELEQLHPGNRHVRDKIRQQLQNLARAGFLIHAGRNDYRVR